MPLSSYEYVNEFLYFVVRPAKENGERALLYCSGINIYRFLPITKGRHRPMSNPAMRGLQLVNLGVRALALSNGATPKAIRGDFCSGNVPVGNGWYKDHLLIENAPESLPHEIIGYSVMNLLKKICKAILLDVNLPDKLLKPDELQDFLETLCIKYGGNS